MDTSTNCKAKLDQAKHVNYAYGMVLGVDDFTQEFAYLSGRDQWMVRDILGYGTVCGLKVTVDPDNRIHVTPGTTVNQQGQMICINRDQCADLNKWLTDDKNSKELASRLGSPPGSDVTIYVVLSYRECLTDERPIPGEPCRDEKELMAPSRVTDDYRLELSFDTPRQCEERELRAFVKGLGNYVSISDAPGCITTLDHMKEFTDWVSDSILSDSSPPGFGIGSPPALLLIHPDIACAYLRAAFRIWVTELRQKCRPNFLADWCGCAGDSAIQVRSEPEERVLLAELQLTVENGSVKGEVGINEENRPYLLTLRMLQELLLCGPKGDTPGSGTSQFSASSFAPYQVVAAGIVKGDTTSRTPVLRHLRALAANIGEITFTFDGYQQPDDTFQYIVKVLGVSHPSLKVPTVRFLEFRAEGFVLQVTGGVTKVKVDVIQKLEFILEVSRLGVAYE